MISKPSHAPGGPSGTLIYGRPCDVVDRYCMTPKRASGNAVSTCFRCGRAACASCGLIVNVPAEKLGQTYGRQWVCHDCLPEVAGIMEAGRLVKLHHSRLAGHAPENDAPISRAVTPTPRAGAPAIGKPRPPAPPAPPRKPLWPRMDPEEEAAERLAYYTGRSEQTRWERIASRLPDPATMPRKPMTLADRAPVSYAPRTGPVEARPCPTHLLEKLGYVRPLPAE